MELLVRVAVKETIAPASKRVLVHEVIGIESERAPKPAEVTRFFNFFMQASADLVQPLTPVPPAVSASDVFIHLPGDEVCVNGEEGGRQPPFGSRIRFRKYLLGSQDYRCGDQCDKNHQGAPQPSFAAVKQRDQHGKTAEENRQGERGPESHEQYRANKH